MTIDASNNNPFVNYSVAEGVTQTVFAVPFDYFEDTDVKVYVDGILKTQGTDYTMVGGDGSTGTITFVTATPPDVQQVTGATGGSVVTLIREVAVERVTDFVAGMDINRAALNTQLDVLTAIVGDLSARQLGYNQTWQDVFESREVNTVYLNTTGRPIMVTAIAVGFTGNTFVQGEVSQDGTTFVAAGYISTAGFANGISFIVPPSHFYRLSGSITYWNELR